MKELKTGNLRMFMLLTKFRKGWGPDKVQHSQFMGATLEVDLDNSELQNLGGNSDEENLGSLPVPDPGWLIRSSCRWQLMNIDM